MRTAAHRYLERKQTAHPIGNTPRTTTKGTLRDMSLSKRDYTMLALGWDAAVKAMRHEDGSPVEIVAVVNPFAQLLEDE